MPTQKKILVLGGGIAAEMVIFSLLKHHQFNKNQIQILQISNEFKYPPCSIHSTSFVCLRNTQKNLSELGDRIIDAYSKLKEFIALYEPNGIEKGLITHLATPGTEFEAKFKRRFPEFRADETFISFEEECFFFSPHRFMPWLKRSNDQIERLQAEILKLTDDKVITSAGEFYFDKVVIATSAYSKFFSDRYPKHQAIEKSVPISGSYLLFQHDFGDKSFGYELDESYVIYRGKEKELLVGATTVRLDESYEHYKQRIHEDEKLELLDIYESLKSGLKPLLELPDLAKAKSDRGFRHRGYKRNPFWGQMDEKGKVFGILGLYKNGYSLPFLAGPQLAEKILSKMVDE